MAAHSVTILTQLTGNWITERTRLEVIQAIEFAPGMDFHQISFEQFQQLERVAKFFSLDALRDCLLDVLSTQLQKWQALGRPHNTEAWKKATTGPTHAELDAMGIPHSMHSTGRA